MTLTKSKSYNGVSVKNRLCRIPRDFDTIQKAIDVSDKGDVIIVSSGTYKEDLEIDCEDIKMIGANSGVAGYSDLRNEEAKIDGFLKVTADAKRITIEGFKILGKSCLHGNGVRFANNKVESDEDGVGVKYPTPKRSNDFNIIQNQITAEDEYGMIIDLDEEYGAIRVLKNIIKECENGIQTMGESKKRALLNISRNWIKGNKRGVNIDVAKGKVKMLYNCIEHNLESGLEAGLNNHHSLKGLEVEYNQIKNNEGDGVFFKGGKHLKNVQVQKNNLFKNDGFLFRNEVDEEIDATNNWWGEEAPAFEEKIQGQVDYVPWLRREVKESGTDIEEK
ncbi:MAG: right-handed parallel beta-helix repeat-containing protein [Thermoplasmatota archaeon]